MKPFTYIILFVLLGSIVYGAGELLIDESLNSLDKETQLISIPKAIIVKPVIDTSLQVVDYTKLLKDTGTKPDKQTIDKLSIEYVKDYNTDKTLKTGDTKNPITTNNITILKQLVISKITFTYARINGQEYTIVSAK